jgi:hypothetical protein
VSYRRSDSSDTVGRLLDRLKAEFGENCVFLDVESISYGEDFRSAVQRGLHQCRVVLVAIGEKWLSVTDETGKRRLDDPNDYVRIEVSTALKSDLLVVPVLVHDTKMPTESALPDDLKSISYRNAARVRDDPDFSADMERLCKQLRKHLNRKPLLRRPAVLGVLVREEQGPDLPGSSEAQM